MAGIAIPGYFYLVRYGNTEVFVAASLISLTFIFFGCIMFILLGAINFPLLNYDYASLVLPLFFATIGFNILAFKIKRGSV